MTPSQVVVIEAAHPVATVDAKGRRLKLRRLTALDTLRLFKAAGPVLAQNEPWLSMAGMAFSVLEIDGVPVPAPISEAQIEGLIDRLGDEGLAAIANAIQAEFSPSATRADVGNSQGTPS
jgi:hypothetical protein